VLKWLVGVSDNSSSDSEGTILEASSVASDQDRLDAAYEAFRDLFEGLYNTDTKLEGNAMRPLLQLQDEHVLATLNAVVWALKKDRPLIGGCSGMQNSGSIVGGVGLKEGKTGLSLEGVRACKTRAA